MSITDLQQNNRVFYLQRKHVEQNEFVTSQSTRSNNLSDGGPTECKNRAVCVARSETEWRAREAKGKLQDFSFANLPS